jgi:hypothetical protein
MHRCLCILDILYMIFYLVFNSRTVDLVNPGVKIKVNFYSFPRLLPNPKHVDRPSLLHLALTCRAFRDPALHVLYSHLRDIRPVITSLPQELTLRPWVGGTSQQFSLVCHPARVKILHGFLKYDHPAYSFLLANAPKNAPLFPHLRSLAWYICDLTSIPALSLLLPTVENLSLTILTPFREAVIPGLRAAAPRLKALELRGDLFTIDKPSEIDPLLRSYSPEGLTQLSLTSCDIPSSLLYVIASWPKLQSLTLQLGHKSIPTIFYSDTQLFESLMILQILCKNLGLVTSFLRAFRMLRAFPGDETPSLAFSNLQKIHITTEGCSTGSIWSELLSIVTCTALEHIILAERCNLICLAHSAIAFYPLLKHHAALTRLKTLVLSPGPTLLIALTDADILALSHTCPHLNFLDLGVRNTPVSLYALDALVRRCRELLQVSLCLDARLNALTVTPPKNDDKVALQPNTRLVKLEVGESPIGYMDPSNTRMAPDLIMSIPRFLHEMAPFLRGITERPPGAWCQEGSSHPWLEVSYTLEAFVSGDI